MVNFFAHGAQPGWRNHQAEKKNYRQILPYGHFVEKYFVNVEFWSNLAKKTEVFCQNRITNSIKIIWSKKTIQISKKFQEIVTWKKRHFDVGFGDGYFSVAKNPAKNNFEDFRHSKF